MIEKKMDQRTKADRVVGNGNWENYMWPHQIDKTAKPVDEQKTKQPAAHKITNNINTVEKGATQYFNSVGTNFHGPINFNQK